MSGAGNRAHLFGQDRSLSSLIKRSDEVAIGLPFAEFESTMNLVAPGGTEFMIPIIPKATLARRRKRQRLSTEESDRLIRLQKVWDFAIFVWDDVEHAQAFLSRPHPMLGGQVPREMAVISDPGADAVINLIGGGAYGGGV
jgi:putative toxin-antitoxin system antitoxin component (TIGR02293 family)